MTRSAAVVAELGECARFVVGDLSDAESSAMIVRETIAAFRQFDDVVNNSARVVRSDSETTDARTFDNVLATKVRALFVMIQAALPHLKASRGCPLNIGSMNAYTGESNFPAYRVSKGALQTLSRNLADALCYDGVRINHVNVGWVLTPNEYHYKLNDGLPENWTNQVPAQFAPLRRLMKPDEIAAAAMHWLPDDSRPFSAALSAWSSIRSSVVIPRNEAIDAQTGGVPQSVHGPTLHRRHDVDPPVD